MTLLKNASRKNSKNSTFIAIQRTWNYKIVLLFLLYFKPPMHVSIPFMNWRHMMQTAFQRAFFKSPTFNQLLRHSPVADTCMPKGHCIDELREHSIMCVYTWLSGCMYYVEFQFWNYTDMNTAYSQRASRAPTRVGNASRPSPLARGGSHYICSFMSTHVIFLEHPLRLYLFFFPNSHLYGIFYNMLLT